MYFNSAILFILFFFFPLAQVMTMEQSQHDVLFVVLGKTVNHRQSADAKHKLLNYHFFAEIFLKENGSVTNAALLIPGGDNSGMVFEGDSSVLEVHGGRYASEEALNSAFPDGKYIFSYGLSDNRVINESVVIKNGSGQSRIPDPITIYLSQEGKTISPSSIDADKNLTITWSAFDSGNADPDGIVDDLMFVVTGNCHGEKVDHSGGPFGSGTYLTFASTEYVIPASALQPGEAFQIFVEQAEMDSGMYKDIPEIATYAATTFLDIRTSGEKKKERAVCPKVMPAMDGGQSDRPRKIK